MSRLQQKVIWLQCSECQKDGLTIRKYVEISDIDKAIPFRW